MADEVCRYCGKGRHPVTQCPRVASIEFDKDGWVKRVEFHPEKPEQEAGEGLIRAFFGDPDKFWQR